MKNTTLAEGSIFLKLFSNLSDMLEQFSEKIAFFSRNSAILNFLDSIESKIKNTNIVRKLAQKKEESAANQLFSSQEQEEEIFEESKFIKMFRKLFETPRFQKVLAWKFR